MESYDDFLNENPIEIKIYYFTNTGFRWVVHAPMQFYCSSPEDVVSTSAEAYSAAQAWVDANLS
jgi:hypothetical protein